MRFSPVFVLLAAGALINCGGSVTAASTNTGSGGTTPAPTANPYAAAYQTVKWGSTMTVTFPTSCTIQIVTTGRPDYTPNAYYLAPGMTPVVAYTAMTNTAVGVVAYSSIAAHLSGSSVTLNDCPSPAASPAATSLGAIGFLISGTAMFNPFEMDASTPAVADNASYTFTDSNGVSQTAYFLDPCDSHSNGSTWHAHGDPDCITAQAGDTSSGPSHILGIALDGYPIYGGRDINGNPVAVGALDACNGITSPTPEFPNGAYHYVLPIGVSTKFASINCYSGTVSQGTLARMEALGGHMKERFAAIQRETHSQGVAPLAP